MVKELVTYFGLILFTFCALVCSMNQTSVLSKRFYVKPINAD